MQLYRAEPASERPAGAATLMVLAHGAGAGQRHPFMIAIAKGLSARGIDVATFDFPYMREKRRAPDRTPVLEQAFVDAVSEARSAVGVARRLFIGGKSMGGRIATHLAAQSLEGLEGVLALGYPLHPPGKPDQRRVAHLPSIRVPVLIVQGERDAFGTPDELRQAIAEMTTEVTLHVVPGGDHSLRVPSSAALGQRQVYDSVLDVAASWITSHTAGGVAPAPPSSGRAG